MTQGLLAHGANHFIVNGREPDETEARELVRRWEVPEIGRPAGAPWKEWTLCTRAFREDLAWAIVLETKEANSAAVGVLLDEMQARGIEVRRIPGLW